MATTTLDVTEELTLRLGALRERNPELLTQILELLPAGMRSDDFIPLFNYAVCQETLDFLAAAPTPEQIRDFKVSAAVQERLDELLERNREEWLTEAERNELAAYSQLGHLMTRLKARAFGKLKSSPGQSAA